MTTTTPPRFTAADLQLFAHPFRDEFMTPFSHEGHTYVTDGRLMLRVDRLEDVPRECPIPVERLESVGVVAGRPAFKTDDVTEWQPLPTLTGTQYKQVCETCFECGRVYDECPDCKGEAFVRVWDDADKGVAVGNRRLNPTFVRKLAILPGIEITTQFGAPEEPVYFRFTGGVGLLMPLKPGA